MYSVWERYIVIQYLQTCYLAYNFINYLFCIFKFACSIYNGFPWGILMHKPVVGLHITVCFVFYCVI